MTAAAARADPAPGEPDLAYTVERPSAWDGFVVAASPHSGRLYPPELLAASRLSPTALRRSEDAFVDALFAGAPRAGTPLICARYGRAYVDVNREAHDLDPAMFEDPAPALPPLEEGRARSGLGSVARLVAEGMEIYRGKLAFPEVQARLARVHAPYHAALDALLGEAHARCGAALLVDGHSMPSAAAPRGCDVVLGDRHGRACAPEVVVAAERALQGCGLRVSRNRPFAGGHATRRHGRPAEGRHALQVEINRGLYLHEESLSPRPAFSAVRAAMDALLLTLRALPAAALAPEPAPLAAAAAPR